MMREVISRQQKRQAIARGLSPYFSQTALEKALCYWEDVYGDKPAFVLNRFVNDICHNEELKQQRKEILRQVLYEMAEAERQVHDIAPSVQQQTAQMPAVHIVDAFRLLLEQIMQHIATADVADFDTELKSALQKQAFGLGTVAQFDAQVFADVIPISRYAEFLTLMYGIFCEFYGPPRADYVYARAKEQVKLQFPRLNLNELL